jgi:O-antigen ligase
LKNKLISATAENSWYAMIAVLPITSMPLVALLLGSDSVASPSILFLIAVVMFWLIPSFIKNKPFHPSILPLFLFMMAAILGSVFSFFYDIPAFKGVSQYSPIFSAFSTLIIGFLFFVCASSFPIDMKIRKKTLRIINWSGFIIFLWCGVQAASWYTINKYPQWMFELQGLISARVLYRQRVTGFALEPSWLAHQLNMFYLPFWLSFTLHKKSNHSFRLFFLTFENILLALGVISLLLTLSRVGVAAFLFMLVLIGIVIHGKIVDFLMKNIVNKSKFSRKLISTVLIILYIMGVGLTAFVFSKVDPRMAGLFEFSFENENPFINYFNELKFGDRVIYWWTGWNIFGNYPIFGVGLGNAGFFFPTAIPPEGWQLVEVSRLMNRTSILLNIKSLWVRLLAETGMIGFSLFFGWLLFLAYYFIKKMRSEKIDLRIMGYAGIFILLGIVFEGLSIDSFAMPYWWISLGLAVSDADINKKLRQDNPG